MCLLNYLHTLKALLDLAAVGIHIGEKQFVTLVEVLLRHAQSLCFHVLWQCL